MGNELIKYCINMKVKITSFLTKLCAKVHNYPAVQTQKILVYSKLDYTDYKRVKIS